MVRIAHVTFEHLRDMRATFPIKSSSCQQFMPKLLDALLDSICVC